MNEPALHEQFDRNEEMRAPSDRAFGIALAAVFSVAGGLRTIRGLPPRWWALGVSAALLGCALLGPSLFHPVVSLWMPVSRRLSRLVTLLVMGLLFFTVIAPVGVVRRLMGKDPLRLRRDAHAGSYWIERRPAGPAPESMSHQF